VLRAQLAPEFSEPLAKGEFEFFQKEHVTGAATEGEKKSGAAEAAEEFCVSRLLSFVAGTLDAFGLRIQIVMEEDWHAGGKALREEDDIPFYTLVFVIAIHEHHGRVDGVPWQERAQVAIEEFRMPDEISLLESRSSPLNGIGIKVESNPAGAFSAGICA